MNKNFLLFGVFMSSVLTLPCPAQAQDDLEMKFSTGFDYSEGDYGDSQNTEIWYFPVTGKVTKGNWAAKLTVPYLRIKGPGAVIGGGDVSVNQSGGTVVTTESGLGDVVAGMTYTVDVEKYNAYVDLTGKLKIPTADEDKGLGTGETDYTALVDITKIFGDVYVSGSIGRKFVGESARFPLDDIWLLNVGSGYQLTSETSIGAFYDFRESASATGDDPSEITAYLTHKITDKIGIQAYGVVGFSDGSPDTGIGVQLGYKFDPFSRP